jgi:hypothetical protein
VPRSLLTKDFPKDKHDDNSYLVEALDWEGNVDPEFKDSHYLEPIIASGSDKDGFIDRWIVYGRIKGAQDFTAKELTVNPGAKVTIKDGGAYGWITVQGEGKVNGLKLQTPAMIRFGQMTMDEVFVTAKAAGEGVVFENTGTEPLVGLRYFGPEAQKDAPEVGAYNKK